MNNSWKDLYQDKINEYTNRIISDHYLAVLANREDWETIIEHLYEEESGLRDVWYLYHYTRLLGEEVGADLNLLRCDEHIKADLFAKDKWLYEIQIPANVTYIFSAAFNSCINLKKVEFENGSELIGMGSRVFENCPNLKEIELPEGMRTIGHSTFAMCDNLKKVVLPESLTTMGDALFSESSNLEQIEYRGTVGEFLNRFRRNGDWREASYITKVVCNDGIIDLSK